MGNQKLFCSFEFDDGYAGFAFTVNTETEGFDISALSQMLLYALAQYTCTLAVNYGDFTETETKSLVNVTVNLDHTFFNIHAS